ncbi:MAG: type II toxin-antitoxin system VapC family toxin [Planctomycetes bacterium]|nr:type II toxin-antitoxin system VapC family toxin [Planctomycetota bacterium]
MVILLDTGILLRLVDRGSPLHSSIRAAVRVIKARGDTVAMAAQNVAEFWNVCTRPAAARGGMGLSIADTNQRLRLLERIVTVLPDSPAAYPIWRKLVVSLGVVGVQVHDTRLVALMQVHGVTHILTLNTADFVRFAGITALDLNALISPTP